MKNAFKTDPRSMKSTIGLNQDTTIHWWPPFVEQHSGEYLENDPVGIYENNGMRGKSMTRSYLQNKMVEWYRDGNIRE